MRMVKLYLIYFLFISISVSAQINIIDSLEIKVAKENDISKKIILYNTLCDNLWHKDPAKASVYADSSFQLVSTINFPEGMVDALVNKGISAYTLGDYINCEKFYFKAIEVANQNNINNTETFLLYINLLKRQGNFFRAIELGDSLLSAIPETDENYPYILLTVPGSYLEVGDLANSKKYLDKINNRILNRLPKVDKAKFINLKAKHYSLTGKYDLAIVNLYNALHIYSDEADIFGNAKAYLDLGNIYRMSSRFDSSRICLEKSKTLYDSTNYLFGIAENYREFGLLYYDLGRFNEAIEYLFKSLQIYENQNNTNEISHVYNDLGWTYYYGQHLPDKALNYINKSIELSKKQKNPKSESTAYNHLGVILYEEGKYNEALKHLKNSLAIRNKLGYSKDIAATKYNIGLVYEELGNFSKALNMYLVSYKIEKELGNLLGISISENTLGRFYLKINKLNKANEYLEKARNRLLTLNSKQFLIENYLYTANYFEQTGNYRKATDFYKKYNELKEIVFNENKITQIHEIEALYNLETKEKEIALLNLEKANRQQRIDLQEKTINNQKLTIISISAGLIFIGALLFLTHRLLRIQSETNKVLQNLNSEIGDQKEKIVTQTEELQEANSQVIELNRDLETKIDHRTEQLSKAYKELDTFFYRSSHDFRGPLTTFLGLCEVAKCVVKESHSLELFDKVKDTALNLDRVVNKLQAFSLISHTKLEKELIDFEVLINQLKQKGKNHMDDNKINFCYKVNVDSKFYSYPDLIIICLENLLENSINYSKFSDDSYIRLQISEEDQQVLIKISDNGVGIKEAYQSKIYDMFYRANEKSKGNGLGLYIVKKVVEKLDGNISVESRPDEGTEFTISIPYGMP